MMSPGGGAPPSPGDKVPGSVLQSVMNTLQQLQSQMESQQREILNLHQAVIQQTAPPVAPVAPPPLAAPSNDLLMMFVKSTMETNQLMLTRALERPESPAPVSPLADPVVQELLRSKEEMYKMMMDVKAPGSSSSDSSIAGDSAQGKLQGVVTKLVEQQIDRLLKGGDSSEEKEGLFDKFLDAAERTGGIDKIMGAAADRLRGDSSKGAESPEEQDLDPLNDPDVDPPASQRSLPPSNESPSPQPSGSDIPISQVSKMEDLIVAAAAAIRDNMPPTDFVRELPQEARRLLKMFPEQDLLAALRRGNIPILKSTRARQWVQNTLRLL